VPIALATGQQLTLPLRLARGGVITGRPTSATGEPVPAVIVTASRIDQSDPKLEHALIDAGEAMSDEDGRYRIYGLPEGDFVVTAWPGPSKDDAAVFAPTSYPSAATAAGASLIAVKAGDERDGADIMLLASRRAAVKGQILDATGRPAASLEVTITPTGGTRLTSVGHSRRGTTRTGTDGSFAFADVLTGAYTVTAAVASVDVHVDGRDTTGVSLQLTAAPSEAAGAAPQVPDSALGGARGTLTSAGAPAPDFLIVVFSADRAQWAPTSGLTPILPPDTNGQWTTAGLPPGDYRVAAISEWSRYDTVTSSLLEQLMAASAPITVKAGDLVVIDLRIGG